MGKDIKACGLVADPRMTPTNDAPVTVEEGRIAFKRDAPGSYAVYSDCATGEMQFVGYVEKNDRPLMNDNWWGRIPGKKGAFSAATRMECAERMVRA